MNKPKIPVGERRFIKSMGRRLGHWRKRDFLGELKSAVSDYQQKLESLAVSEFSRASMLVELDKAEHEYRRVFGDFCGLMSALKPRELVDIESKFMDMASVKEESESSCTPLRKIVLSALRRPEKHTLMENSLALQWSRKNDLPLAFGRAKLSRKLQSARLKVSYLESKYAQSIDREKQSVLFVSKTRLAGLPKPGLKAAAHLAAASGKTGWSIPLDMTLRQESTHYLSRMETRKRVYAAALSRGIKVKNTARKLARLRHRTARLAGFKSWAAMRMKESSSFTEKKAWSFLRQLAKKTLPQANSDLALAEANGWDRSKASTVLPWPFLQDKFHGDHVFDPTTVLERGCFRAAKTLFNLRIEKIRGVRLYEPEVLVYRATLPGHGCIGYLAADLFSRSGKEQGAWTSCWEDSSAYGGLPFVGIFCNLEKTGCSFSGAEDIFHEFGHAIHSLLTGHLPSPLTALNMPNELTEVPSLMAEAWLLEPTIYNRIRPRSTPAQHQVCREQHRSGSGLEQMGDIISAAVDLVWHGSDMSAIKTDKSVRQTALKKLGLAGENLCPPTYSEACFPHIFCDGYDGSYFSYLWCEIQASQINAWLKHKKHHRHRRGLLLRAMGKGATLGSPNLHESLGLRHSSP